MPLTMLVDSGSEKNIIDEQTWRLMVAKGFQPKKQYKDDSITFSDYVSGRLKQLLVFEDKISVKINGKEFEQEAPFYVIQEGSQPLLGRVTAELLNILHITVPDLEPKSINTISKNNSFPKIKGVLIHIPMKENAVPIQLTLRRAPVALVERMKRKLEELEDLDIIERVNKPSPWISALVSVIKDCGDIDLRREMKQFKENITQFQNSMILFQT